MEFAINITLSAWSKSTIKSIIEMMGSYHTDVQEYTLFAKLYSDNVHPTLKYKKLRVIFDINVKNKFQRDDELARIYEGLEKNPYVRNYVNYPMYDCEEKSIADALDIIYGLNKERRDKIEL